MANEVVKKIQDNFLSKVSESGVLDARLKNNISNLFSESSKISKKEITDTLELLIQPEEAKNENSEADS